MTWRSSFAEDCVYELPKCAPPPELYRDMRLINGKLPTPPPPPPPKTVKKIPITQKETEKTTRQIFKTTSRAEGEEKVPICKEEEDKGSKWSPFSLVNHVFLSDKPVSHKPDS